MDIATAEEILATMAEDCSEYEDVCLIDTETRIISISEKLKVVGVESDEDVVRRTFRMPWKVGENDLSTFSIRINYLNAQGEGDIYTVKDMAKSGDDMTFSWLFSRHATKYRGSIRFVVCMILTDSNGIDKEWNTTLAEFTILEGLETSGQIEEDNPDAIENILLRLNKLESTGGVSDEQIGNAVNDYLTKNPIKPGATQEQAEQIEANKRAIEELQQNGAGGGITEETDPTVPAWAKADTKPKYTADEVGALPNTTVIPTVPNALKNPYPLTINGVAYDGSEAKTINIHASGGGESVSLDTTLTQYGMAADAGAVGNALAQEKDAREEALNELKEANVKQDEKISALEKTNCLLTVETVTIEDSGDDGGESGGDENIPVTSIVLDYSSLSLNIGESMQLAASVFPNNATNNAITWETSNSGIAMVDNGYVTAVASGDVVITARSVENTSIYATCAVNVATEESGGGSGETSGKIMFTELTPVKGEYMIKGDGVTEYARSNCCYYQLPYSDGMFVSTVGNSSFAGMDNQSNYPAIMVVASDGQVTKPDVTGETIDGSIMHFSTTLSSFENVEKVFVNLQNVWKPSSDTNNPNTINTKFIEYCYYIPGGAL